MHGVAPETEVIHSFSLAGRDARHDFRGRPARHGAVLTGSRIAGPQRLNFDKLGEPGAGVRVSD